MTDKKIAVQVKVEPANIKSVELYYIPDKDQLLKSGYRYRILVRNHAVTMDEVKAKKK
jgi:hypothetical protein